MCHDTPFLFPELALTGAGCGNLFNQSVLLDAAGDAIYDIVGQTEKKDIIVKKHDKKLLFTNKGLPLPTSKQNDVINTF